MIQWPYLVSWVTIKKRTQDFFFSSTFLLVLPQCDKNVKVQNKGRKGGVLFLFFILFLGRQFDKQGNLKQWWNNRTIAEFRKAAECIVQQYSNYTLDEINLAIDGRLTQGENIADNGGLKQAFRVIIQKKKYVKFLLKKL